MTADEPGLLSPMDGEVFQSYHEAIIRSLLQDDESLKIVADVGIGKGMVAARHIPSGQRIFTESPLVRLQ